MYSVDSKEGDTKIIKISLCFGCLSFDRKLKPLGEKLNIFSMLVNDTYSKLPDISLCWECMAVMRKVELFKEKVEHAQTVLSTHVLNAERVKLFCDVCGQAFKTKIGYNTHMHRHKYIRQCLVCDTRICTTALMQYHLRSHFPQVQCNICKLSFPFKKDFTQHYRDMHFKFICDYCGVTRHSKSNLIRHITKHVGIYCEKCDKYLKHYNDHVKLYHTTEITEEAFCVECNRQFRNVYAYKQHLHLSRAHNPVRHEKRRQQRYECPDCHKLYSSRITLNNHHDYVHKGESRHICPHCNRQFLSIDHLKYHNERVHLKLKPEKNKICNYCGKGFSTNKILTHHIRTHTGERPHQCPHCDASFAQKVAMTSHIKNIHGGVVS